MDPAGLPALIDAIRHMHGAEARHVETVHVHETHEGMRRQFGVWRVLVRAAWSRTGQAPLLGRNHVEFHGYSFMHANESLLRPRARSRSTRAFSHHGIAHGFDLHGRSPSRPRLQRGRVVLWVWYRLGHDLPLTATKTVNAALSLQGEEDRAGLVGFAALVLGVCELHQFRDGRSWGCLESRGWVRLASLDR